ncbi:Carnitine O-acetyltransferase mitochondrial [Puccinia graminis f. sp. tritici]|nr:Carnitine O-acetyltransferase mitochondrial [Puccinia graminis f. sp. tritici]
MNDWIVDVLANKKIDLGSSSQANLPAPSPIEFVLSDTTKQNILKAIMKFGRLMYPHTLEVFDYSSYGSRVIKSQFKSSPNTVAQMIFQLGYYKLFGRVPVTWEPSQTRKFKLGRTEVIRSCSIEALEWCKAMENDGADWSARLEKFKIAVKAHLSYSQQASEGQAVDRHLLGLRLSLKPGEEIPPLFQDPVYKESTSWKVATSHMPSENFSGFGYGAVVPDGFGLGYAVNKESIRFTITTPTKNGARLNHYLQEAADDILQMMKFEKGQSSASARL